MTSPSSGGNGRQGSVLSTPIAPNPEEVNEFHRYSDVDTSPDAQHHTIGVDGSQASPGNHNHDGRNSPSIFIDPLALEAPWLTPELTAPFTQAGSGFQTFQYRRIGSRLDFRGHVSSTGNSGTIFTLPTENRPPLAHGFVVTAAVAPHAARVEVYADGRVFLAGAPVGVTTIGFSNSIWID